VLWQSLLSRTKAPTVSRPQNLYFFHIRICGSTAKLGHRVLHLLKSIFDRLIMDGIPPGAPHPITTTLYACHSGIVSPRWRIVYHGHLRPKLCKARKSHSFVNQHYMQFDPSTTVHFVELWLAVAWFCPWINSRGISRFLGHPNPLASFSPLFHYTTNRTSHYGCNLFLRSHAPLRHPLQ
jgi:hypothetical protein